MMYYIEKPQLSRKSKLNNEVHRYITKFKNILIRDELSLDALVEEIRKKVEELNESRPLGQRLIVTNTFKSMIICCKEGKIYRTFDYVFVIKLLPIITTYRFAEKSNVLEKGGDQ